MEIDEIRDQIERELQGDVQPRTPAKHHKVVPRDDTRRGKCSRISL